MNIKTLCTLTAWISLAVGRSFAVVPTKPQKPELLIQISAAKTVLRAKEYPVICISVKNQGKQPATLVQAGDGSDIGMRTPLVRWIIFKLNTHSEQFESFVPEGVPRCGNYNPLSSGEVFTIAPGKTRKLAREWIGFPTLSQPGRYKVLFSYTNRPRMIWSNSSLGPHDAKEMKRVLNSESCSLISNPIIFTITKEKQKIG